MVSIIVSANLTGETSAPFSDSAEWYENGVDFVDGLEAICGAGDPSIKEGLCIYTYLANKGMTERYVLSYILSLKKFSSWTVGNDVVKETVEM